MTLSERLQTIDSIVTLFFLGDITDEEAWEYLLAVVEDETSEVTFH